MQKLIFIYILSAQKSADVLLVMKNIKVCTMFPIKARLAQDVDAYIFAGAKAEFCCQIMISKYIGDWRKYI